MFVKAKNVGPCYKRTVQGTNGPGNECSMERIVLGTNIPDSYLESTVHTRFRPLHIGSDSSVRNTTIDEL